MILNGFCKLCTMHTPKINLIYSILPWFFCTSLPSKNGGGINNSTYWLKTRLYSDFLWRESNFLVFNASGYCLVRVRMLYSLRVGLRITITQSHAYNAAKAHAQGSDRACEAKKFLSRRRQSEYRQLNQGLFWSSFVTATCKKKCMCQKFIWFTPFYFTIFFFCNLLPKTGGWISIWIENKASLLIQDFDLVSLMQLVKKMHMVKN